MGSPVAERRAAPASGAPARAPDLDRAWATLPVALPLIISFLGRMLSIDLAYQVRAGEQILDGGGIPRVETWTFSAAGTEWFNQQWGAQAVFAALYRIGGWAALATARGVLIGLTFWLVYRACRERGATPRTASLLSIAGFVVALPTLAMRPQLLALPLFALSVLAIVTRRSRPRLMWILPIAALVTANLHGSFVLVPTLAALAAVDDTVRRRPDRIRTIAVAVATMVATIANPFGPSVWAYALDLSTNPVIRDTIKEWAPVTLANLSGWLLFGSFLPIFVLSARRREVIKWPDLIVLGAFFLLALTAVRALVWWGVVAPVVVAGWFEGPPGERRTAPAPDVPRRASPGSVIVVTLIAVAVVLLPIWRSDRILLDEAPRGLAAAVSELPPRATIFAPQPWGSWFEFATPDQRVFVDSRIELFSDEVWDDYHAVAFAGAGWEQAIERWQPDAIVADHERWGDAIPLMRSLDTYRVAYEDGDGILFIRD